MDKETKKYEIGYLLSPLIPEEKLDEEISGLRQKIEDQKGLITSEERAKMRKLAYTISHPAVGRVESAYFGWIKFIASPDTLLIMKGLFDKTNNLIRFLIIESAKEAQVKKPATGAGRKKKMPATLEIKTEVKPEEIDKKLEELLSE